ncbi:MAG: crotonase/enoyl-CoA hydratase family protein [Acidimicrobiia bacterium]|nr:crotonase/enoyl-CoA hydratase family protein [Acidimicrobiia bacterium]
MNGEAESSSVVTYEVRERIATARISNGKANVISPEVVGLLDDCLSRAEGAGDDVGALVVTGTPGFLSGGFDLGVMMSSPEAAGRLVSAGGSLFARIYASPVPVIVACTGHAVAAGALLLLAADARIGADGAYKIGLIETAKGMVLPRWAVELAEERLCTGHRQAATVGARMYDPRGAAEAGFLDSVVPAEECLQAAVEEAGRWAALPRNAYAGQVVVNRGARLARLEEALAADRTREFRTEA